MGHHRSAACDGNRRLAERLNEPMTIREERSMTVFGKRLSEYIEFSKVFLILIPLVGITRLALSLGGMPNSEVKWVSITAILWIAVIYYAIRVHIRSFGSYKQLLALYVLLNLMAQAVIISGIILAIFTGTANIYSAPEYAFGSDGGTWLHVAAHLFIGTIAGSLVPWLFGSLILFATRKLARGSDRKVQSVA